MVFLRELLGPLLFLVYINDLPNCLAHAEPRMYADDTHLTFASNNMKDIELYLNQDVANVNQWLIANKLTLNQSKTEFMLIGSRQRLCTFQSAPNLTINGTPVKQVSQAKSLDVYKTWTPGPWTTPLDPVHGPSLWTRSMDHHCGPSFLTLSTYQTQAF